MIIKNLNKDKIFFTSDHHFGHSNIIQFCHRPWEDVRAMDLELIQRWNSVVPEDGIVFHAGDFAMTSNIDYITQLLYKLNGNVYIAFGNHVLKKFGVDQILKRANI